MALDISICGCGNGAHACAALLAKKGHRVTIFSPIKEEIQTFQQNYQSNSGLDALVEGKEIRGIRLSAITDDAEMAFSNASIIFVVVPAFAHRSMLRQAATHMKNDALIVVMPCRGLLELDLKRYVPNANVMAFQTLPWACRIEKPGEKINIKGVKNKIQAACWPRNLSGLYYYLLEELLDMKVECVNSLLTMTFANIGQIFHPGIMYSVLKDDPYRIFPEAQIPLFYQGATEEGADILQRLADEMLQIAEEMHRYDPNIQIDKILSPKQWMLESYGDHIQDKSTLQSMLNTNSAYQGIKVPVIEVSPEMFRADLKARYITEDVPYSLMVTRTLGNMADIETPAMDMVISELGKWSGCDYLSEFNAAHDLELKSRLPVFYGLETLQDVIALN